MCEFVDDKASVFPFEELQRCMVDTLEECGKTMRYRLPPIRSAHVRYGLLRPVTPWRQRRMRGTEVPPAVAGGKFRILERHQWKGMDFATQAESIRNLTEKYA